MLTYLARNIRLDIEYVVHQCARFQFDPYKPHENAMKCIGRKYTLGSLIFKPTEDLSECPRYVDA